MAEDNNTGDKPIELQNDLQTAESAFASMLMAGDAENQEGDEQVDTLATQPDEPEIIEDEIDEDGDEVEIEQYEDDADDEIEVETVAELSDDTLVTLNDGTETTLSELKSGQLRQSDYTKKTQALAEERKAT